MQHFPPLGFGTFLSNANEVGEAVKVAVEKGGYRHIDCAPVYGNEVEVGKALKDLFDRKVVKREELWITSKLWNDMHDPKDVEIACKKTLHDLQLDYLDLYIAHWPIAFKKGTSTPTYDIKFVDTWKAMEKLVEKGLVKRIGVSNTSIEYLEKLCNTPGLKIKPYTNQVELHIYQQQEALLLYCEKHNIMVTGYSPLGSPGYSHPHTPVLLKDEVLNAVAKELNRPVVNVAIRFLQQLSKNVSVLVKSVNAQRVIENAKLDFSLNNDQMDRLRKRNLCIRNFDVKAWCGIDAFADQF